MITLTGGEWNRRKIKSIDVEGVRPSSSMLRQAVFNSIQSKISDSRFLDLYAGFGTMGLEALSRGAKTACFVEKNPKLSSLIAENLETFQASSRSEVFRGPVDDFLRTSRKKFEIIYVDPPYELTEEYEMLWQINWSEVLAPDGCILFEWGKKKSKKNDFPEQLGALVKTKQKHYGEKSVSMYEFL